MLKLEFKNLNEFLVKNANKKFLVIGKKAGYVLIWQFKEKSMSGWCKKCGFKGKLLKKYENNKAIWKCSHCFAEVERPKEKVM